MSVPRLRFAPSPTGYLHVGGARTALFNWLYARRTGGVFVLRIEDTDVERSSAEMVTGILDGMRWIGLDWDEGPEVGGDHGPYFQSQRLARYRELAEQLVREGHAYYCYCGTSAFASSETSAGFGETAAVDDEAAEGDTPRGESWTYDRRCSRLTAEEIAEREAAKLPRAIRFRVPPGETTFHDLVHGDITFDNAHIEDFVALRSDGHPTYHLSVVADDIDMAITHVVRGDDHISNTPKQVMLYRAFGRALPAFAHVPLILGPDKRRLSKRHGATSVTEYSKQGFLPEAMMNFLALLGWSPGDDRELFTRDELVAAFSLEGIASSNAVFNPEKLEWFSAQHIARMPAGELVRRIEPLLREAGLWPAAWGPGASFDPSTGSGSPRATSRGDSPPDRGARSGQGRLDGRIPSYRNQHGRQEDTVPMTVFNRPARLTRCNRQESRSRAGWCGDGARGARCQMEGMAAGRSTGLRDDGRPRARTGCGPRGSVHARSGWG
jgi:glutamyl-tRNA synthetase